MCYVGRLVDNECHRVCGRWKEGMPCKLAERRELNVVRTPGACAETLTFIPTALAFGDTTKCQSLKLEELRNLIRNLPSLARDARSTSHLVPELP